MFRISLLSKYWLYNVFILLYIFNLQQEFLTIKFFFFYVMGPSWFFLLIIKIGLHSFS